MYTNNTMPFQINFTLINQFRNKNSPTKSDVITNCRLPPKLFFGEINDHFKAFNLLHYLVFTLQHRVYNT